ncbi:hypothetical protein ILYODFUR_027925 [Ilyodon furcidens]|uniref:Secreted protein n=1 Tax=Ilyodon furcidens TaxID=33524 RepID=A0ABV0VI84_9TELE
MFKAVNTFALYVLHVWVSSTLIQHISAIMQGRSREIHVQVNRCWFLRQHEEHLLLSSLTSHQEKLTGLCQAALHPAGHLKAFPDLLPPSAACRNTLNNKTLLKRQMTFYLQFEVFDDRHLLRMYKSGLDLLGFRFFQTVPS